MLYLTVLVDKIDYSCLLKEIKSSVQKNEAPSQNSFRNTLLNFIEPMLPSVTSTSFVRRLAAKQANKFAFAYGLTIRTYIEKNKDYNDQLAERNGKNMLILTASVKKIDYQKIINEITKSTPPKDNSLVSDILKIIEPFAAETMKTIPDSAIAELFMLLGRDKLIEMAQGYGVEISDLSLTAPEGDSWA